MNRIIIVTIFLILVAALGGTHPFNISDFIKNSQGAVPPPAKLVFNVSPVKDTSIIHKKGREVRYTNLNVSVMFGV